MPLVIGYVGFGRVSKAAQEIVKLLPHERLSPNELVKMFQKGKFSKNVVYSVEFRKSDIFMKKDGSDFSNYFYNRYPNRFISKFEQFIQYLTVIVNGIYWEPRFPKLITLNYMKQLYESGNSRLRVIADISCDIDGSIELTRKTTSSENPVYVFEPLTGKILDGFKGNGPVMLAHDKLPSEVPYEASRSFGKALLTFIPELVKADYSKPLDGVNVSHTIKRAVIVHKGELTERYKYLNEYL